MFFPSPFPWLISAYIHKEKGAHTHTLFWRTRIYLIRAESLGPEGVSSALLSLSLPLVLLLFPSYTFSSQSPRAKTLMKTNARNQFAASSLHLDGARFCASISTAAGGELLQSSPITHTSILRSSYRLQALLREEWIKMGGLCYLKLCSEICFSSEPRNKMMVLPNSTLHHKMISNNTANEQKWE